MSTKVLAVDKPHKLTEEGGKGQSQVVFFVTFFLPRQMAGCQSSGKSVIVYVGKSVLRQVLKWKKLSSDRALGKLGVIL